MFFASWVRRAARCRIAGKDLESPVFLFFTIFQACWAVARSRPAAQTDPPGAAFRKNRCNYRIFTQIVPEFGLDLAQVVRAICTGQEKESPMDTETPEYIYGPNAPVLTDAPDYLCDQSDAALAYQGPTGFTWLIRGVLGGVPRPGIMRDVEKDVESLARVGIRLLVTLNRNWLAPAELLAEHGIDSFQLKIEDMGAPTPEEARDLCRRVDGYLRQGQACAFHCRAGRGRTGTMLAAQLIFYGMPAGEAVKAVRRKNAKWIESPEQIDFLQKFETSAF